MNEITAQVFSEYVIEIFAVVFEEVKNIEEFSDLGLFVEQCDVVRRKNKEKRETLFLKDDLNRRKYETLRRKFSEEMENKKEGVIKILDIETLIYQLRLNTWED